MVNLQILSLSGNPFDSLDALSELGTLPSLRQLSFKCEHFLPSPVTAVQGYRNYVLSTLSQQSKSTFARLDSEWIQSEDFQLATNEFMDQILRLQEVLEEVERENRHQLQWVSARQQESEEHLARVQAEVLMEADRLKTEVADGRARMQAEIERVRDRRDRNVQ